MNLIMNVNESRAINSNLIMNVIESRAINSKVEFFLNYECN